MSTPVEPCPWTAGHPASRGRDRDPQRPGRPGGYPQLLSGPRPLHRAGHGPGVGADGQAARDRPGGQVVQQRDQHRTWQQQPPVKGDLDPLTDRAGRTGLGPDGVRVVVEHADRVDLRRLAEPGTGRRRRDGGRAGEHRDGLMASGRHRQQLPRPAASIAERIIRRVPLGRRVGVRGGRLDRPERVVGTAERVRDRPLGRAVRQRIARDHGGCGRRQHALTGELQQRIGPAVDEHGLADGERDRRRRRSLRIPAGREDLDRGIGGLGGLHLRDPRRTWHRRRTWAVLPCADRRTERRDDLEAGTDQRLVHGLRRRVSDRCWAQVVAHQHVADAGPAQGCGQARDPLARVDARLDRPEQHLRAGAAIGNQPLRGPRRTGERLERLVDRLAPHEDAVRGGGHDQGRRARRVLPEEGGGLVPVAGHGAERPGVQYLARYLRVGQAEQNEPDDGHGEEVPQRPGGRIGHERRAPGSEHEGVRDAECDDDGGDRLDLVDAAQRRGHAVQQELDGMVERAARPAPDSRPARSTRPSPGSAAATRWLAGPCGPARPAPFLPRSRRP